MGRSIVGASGNRRGIGAIKRSNWRTIRDDKSTKGYAQRNRNLKSLGYSSYAEYLRSFAWATLRELVFKEKGCLCVVCGHHATEIHHADYSMETLVGSTLVNLHPICRICHEKGEMDGGVKRHLRDANRELGIHPIRNPCPVSDPVVKQRVRQRRKKKPQPETFHCGGCNKLRTADIKYGDGRCGVCHQRDQKTKCSMCGKKRLRHTLTDGVCGCGNQSVRKAAL